MNYDIFFYEAFEEEQEKLKDFLPDNIQAGFSWKTIQEYEKDKPEAKIISVRTQSVLPVEWEDELDAILSRSTGYDHLIKYRKNTKTRLELGYLPLYCNRAVAEQAILLMMSLYRKLPIQIQNFKQFNRDGLTGSEVENKTLVVYGVGNIGSEIVKMGQGLGMEVYCVDIEEKHPEFEYVEPEFGFENADVITCSMNLTSQNMNYFSYEKLKKCRKKPVFVNVARGELSHSKELLKALENDLISAVAMDVYNEEDRVADFLRAGKDVAGQEVEAVNKLMQKPNVIFTPHNAFNTIEAVHRKSEQSVQQVEYFLKNDEFYWQIPE